MPPVRWWNSAATSPSSTPRPDTAASSSSTSSRDSGLSSMLRRLSECDARCARVELTRAMRAEDQHVAERHRQQFGQQQQRVSISPLQVVDRQHHRPVGRRIGHQPDGGAVQPAASIRCIEVGHMRGLAQHLRQFGHELPEDAGKRRHPADEICTPTVALGRAGGLHGADNRAERVSQRRVRCRRAVPAPPVGEHAVAPGDLDAEGLRERRLAHSRSPAEQDASSADASGRFHGGSEFGQLLPSVDHTAVEVEQRSRHGAGHTAARTVRRTARQGDRKMKRMPSPSNRNCPPIVVTGPAHRGRDMEPSASPTPLRRRHDSE